MNCQFLSVPLPKKKGEVLGVVMAQCSAEHSTLSGLGCSGEAFFEVLDGSNVVVEEEEPPMEEHPMEEPHNLRGGGGPEGKFSTLTMGLRTR
jgi:hypothetical protein